MKPSARFMLRDLRKSGLDQDDAHKAQLESLSVRKTRELLKNHQVDFSSYEIPYFDREGKRTKFSRWKLAEILVYKDRNKKSHRQKYHQTLESPPQLYMPKAADTRRVFADSSIPVMITEGEKKALKANKEGILTFGLGGVWNFCSARRDIDLIDDLRELAPQRDLFLVFDGNVHTNKNVRRAREVLAGRLTSCKGRVWFIDLPPSVSFDDFLVEHGKEGFDRLAKRPFDAKAHISTIRQEKGSVRSKYAAISNVVEGDLAARGRFLRTSADSILYFDDDERRIVSLDDQKSQELRCYINNAYGVNAAEQEWKFLYENLATYARENGARAEVHLFSYWSHKKQVLYVARSSTEMFRVSASKAKVVPNGRDDVFLIVPAGMTPIDLKGAEGSRSALDFILDMPNLADGHEATAPQLRSLLELWIWGMFFGREALPTRPIVVMHGPKGSSKSSTGRALLKTMFGKAADVSTIDSGRLDGLDAALASQHLLVLDNVDGHYKGIENRLAAAATGGELILRRLYSSTDELRAPARAFVMATTREPDSFTRDDVVDRLLYLPCERREEFFSEGEIIDTVMSQRAAFWAYVIQTLPRLVRAFAKARKHSTRLRMADFANFGRAIAKAIGYRRSEVFSALKAAEQEKVAFVAEQSQLPEAFLQLLESDTIKLPMKNMSATELLDRLRGAVPHFPFRNPVSFGQRLQSELPAIRKSGVDIGVEYSSSRKAWRYTLNGKIK